METITRTHKDQLRFVLFSFLVLSAVISASLFPTRARAQAAPPSTAEIISSYEGQHVSAVELVGRPDLDQSALEPMLAQKAGESFSRQKLDATISALKATGKFQNIELEVRPEFNGVRVRFILQPALYFGMYDFPGATTIFPYSRLLQVSNYQAQEPYSAFDVQQAQTELTKFFQRSGFFLAEVQPQPQPDPAHGLVNVNFNVALNRRAKIGEVSFQGSSPEESAHLEKSLHSIMARLRGAYLKNGTKYTMKKLRLATAFLQRELSKHQHLTAEVKLVGANYHPETNRADIVFHVTAGPEVRIATTGAHVWSWTRKKLVPIYQENLLNDELVQEGQRNLTSYFQSKGYFNAKVDSQVERQPSTVKITYRIEKGPRHRVKKISVAGNEHFDDKDVLSRVAVSKARFLSHGNFSDQLLRKSVSSISSFYHGAGYSQVKVTPRVTREEENLVVAFYVQEGPQDIVESLNLKGNNTVPLSQLAPKGLQLGQGKPYSGPLVQEDRNNVMARYLELGYLTANFRATAKPVDHDPHRLAITYEIYEGPKVVTAEVVTIGRRHAKQSMISNTARIKSNRPLSQDQLLTAESRLYNLNVFDWAKIDPRRPITAQTNEDVLIKVHESKRNALTFGVGFEVINRGGSLPSGTVVVPGIPPVGLPSSFTTSEKTFWGPRGSVEYTRRDLRGTAQSYTVTGFAGRLDQRGSLAYTIPAFRGSSWTASALGSGENNTQNPIFSAQLGQAGIQFQKALDAKKTKNVILRYSFQYTSLSSILIPGLVPTQDQQYHLSGLSAAYSRDTRDSILDAHRGIYQSFEIGFNTSALGSSADFARFLGQTAYYRNIGHGIIWANSLRLGLEQSFNGSFVPLSELFFTGGGSTLRGFPLNGAGPQRQLCLTANPCTSQITVPVGGNMLLIANTELRIPTPIKKGLGIALFYDGGNVFAPIGIHNWSFGNCGTNVVNNAPTGTVTNCFSSSIGAGLRYATPVGPVRIDIGHNLNGIPGIKSTQLFITLGQAF